MVNKHRTNADGSRYRNLRQQIQSDGSLWETPTERDISGGLLIAREVEMFLGADPSLPIPDEESHSDDARMALLDPGIRSQNAK